jgi:carbohydrate-selective porin OprB
LSREIGQPVEKARFQSQHLERLNVLRQPFAQAHGERRISTFLQLGWAEGRVSGFTHHVGGGAILQGPLQRRKQDSVGFATTWVRFSSEPNAGFDLRSELVLESYYKVTFNSTLLWCRIFNFCIIPAVCAGTGTVLLLLRGWSSRFESATARTPAVPHA